MSQISVSLQDLGTSVNTLNASFEDALSSQNFNFKKPFKKLSNAFRSRTENTAAPSSSAAPLFSPVNSPALSQISTQPPHTQVIASPPQQPALNFPASDQAHYQFNAGYSSLLAYGVGQNPIHLDNAITHFSNASARFTPETNRIGTANTQTALGTSYKTRYELSRNPVDLDAAIGHFKRASELYTRETEPSAFARAHMNLGHAHRARFDLAHNPLDIDLTIGYLSTSVENFNLSTNQYEPPRASS